MRHCQDCNKNYSDKYFNKHCRSNIHLKKAFEVKYIYKKENIFVGEIDNILSSIIEKHKRKFLTFYIVCRINNNKKIIGYPKRVLLKYYDKKEFINVEFNFYSNREDMAFNYYMLQPKPMLETMIIKNLDRYPEKLKILDYSRAPYYDYLILKYYGFAMMNYNKCMIYCIRDDWLHNTPRDPDDNFKEILRSR